MLWWDNDGWSGTTTYYLVALVFQLCFFIFTVVILMNLLIAMMGQTYGDTYAKSKQEYEMQFAKLVKVSTALSDCNGDEVQ
jgi:hypothetical protein